MSKLKRIICVLTSCTVLIFGCYFLPKQRAEASLTLTFLGTAAGFCALGMLLYGVCTSSDDSFVNDHASDFASDIGFSSLNPDSFISQACFDATIFLYSAGVLAAEAYNSGYCSSFISSSNPISVIDNTFKLSIPSSVLTLSYTNSEGTHTLNLVSETSNPVFISLSSDSSKIFFYSSCSFSGTFVSPLVWDRLNNGSPKIGCEYYSSFDGYGSSLQGGTSYPGIISNLVEFFSYFGYTLSPSTFSTLSQFANSIDPSLEIDTPITSKPVIPGACDVFNSSKSLDSYHVDSPGNDVLDIGNLLEKTGCDTVDDVVSKVYTGELSVQDVFDGLHTQPYVDVDVDTGTIAIPGETTNSRPVSLDKDLSIPADIVGTDTYVPANPPLDNTTNSRPKGAYSFPLADFFPFCLPFDLYQFCNLFVAPSKTPVITLDFSTFLPYLDKDNPDQYVYTFDLHSLDKLAQIIRNLELFGIVLGLGLITRRIIGW